MNEQNKENVRREPWSQMASGTPFDLLIPRVQDVNMEDIATSLCRQSRYGGHTLSGTCYVGYSVAQHSVMVSAILEQWGAPVEVVREGLLHDAGEAYYGDVTNPVQRALRDLHREMISTAATEVLRSFDERGPSEWSVASTALARMADRLRESDPLHELKCRVDRVVREAFGLPAIETPIVKRADLVALACERVTLMAPCEREWELPEYADSRWLKIVPDEPSVARHVFMARLSSLDARMQGSR